MNNMFSMFNTFGMFGNTKKKYNPYINYTWQMLPNAKVKNSGTSGVDLQLYSGNPLDFQATQGIQVNKSFTLSGNAISLFLGFDTDSIAITHTLAEFDNLKVSIVNAILRVTINAVNHDVATLIQDTYYQTEIVINSNNLTVKLDGIQTYSASCTALNTTMLKSLGANDGLASGRFDGQFDYFIAYNGLTTFSLPNQFFKDMSTNSNTLFATDFRGNVGYIADSKNYSVGVELVTNGGFDTNLSGWTQSGTSLTWVAGKGKYLRAYFGDRFIQTINNLVIGNKYIVNFTLSNIAATSVRLGFSSVSSNSSIELYSSNSDGSFSVVVVATATTQYITGDTNVNGDGFTIDNVSIKELSGVYPITNYSATQRSNFTQVNKGLQDLTRSFDSNGFFVDNVSYLNCNGKNYGDTGWISSASEDWTVTCFFNNSMNSVIEIFGVYADNAENRMYMQKHSNNSVRAYVGNVGSGYIYSGAGLTRITITYNASTKSGKFVINKTNIVSYANINFLGCISPFYLGVASRNSISYGSYYYVGANYKLRVDKKVLTDIEIQELQSEAI